MINKPIPGSTIVLVSSLFLGFAFALPGLLFSLSDPNIVQDDARQHVFWLYRYVDKNHFPNNLIADYFQSVAPFGYTALYRLAILLGLEPLLFNKLLPTVLGLFATYFCYRLSLAVTYSKLAAMLACLFLNLTMWTADDLVSGTPRAFVYPLLLAGFYYLQTARIIPTLAVLLLQGSFYPQALLITAGVLVIRLVNLENYRCHWVSDRDVWRFSLTGLATAALILLPFIFTSSHFGPVISREVAEQLPQFQKGGRSAFFYPSWLKMYFSAYSRGAIWPYGLKPILGYLLTVLAIALPYNRRLNGDTSKSTDFSLLWQILASSFVLFLMAHLLLFKLHLPSRYVAHTLKILLAVFSGASSAYLISALPKPGKRLFSNLVIATQILILTFLVAYFPVIMLQGKLYSRHLSYTQGNEPELYRYLNDQPHSTNVASLSSQTDFIPLLAKRSILVAREYAIPYHMGYFSAFETRIRAVILAQYSLDPLELYDFIDRYSVSHFLLDQDSFNSEYLGSNSVNKWLYQYQQEIAQARQNLSRTKPVLAGFAAKCTVWQGNSGAYLVDANCIVRSLKSEMK
jgi:hypothetical protein